MESRTKGWRPRTQKNPRPRLRTALPRTDPLEAKDRNALGQGQGHKRKCSPKKKGLQKFFSGDLQNFKDSKNSTVLEPRTGQFSGTRLRSFEAKVLTFKTKAKNFKMCPRGQDVLEDSTSGAYTASTVTAPIDLFCVAPF